MIEYTYEDFEEFFDQACYRGEPISVTREFPEIVNSPDHAFPGLGELMSAIPISYDDTGFAVPPRVFVSYYDNLAQVFLRQGDNAVNLLTFNSLTEEITFNVANYSVDEMAYLKVRDQILVPLGEDAIIIPEMIPYALIKWRPTEGPEYDLSTLTSELSDYSEVFGVLYSPDQADVRSYSSIWVASLPENDEYGVPYFYYYAPLNEWKLMCHRQHGELIVQNFAFIPVELAAP